MNEAIILTNNPENECWISEADTEIAKYVSKEFVLVTEASSRDNKSTQTVTLYITTTVYTHTHIYT